VARARQLPPVALIAVLLALPLFGHVLPPLPLAGDDEPKPDDYCWCGSQLFMNDLDEYVCRAKGHLADNSAAAEPQDMS
jgi:hypothetical protein